MLATSVTQSIAIASVVTMLSIPSALWAASNSSEASVDQNAINDFLQSASANNVNQLANALEKGVPIDSKDKKGRTALLIATYNNAIEASRYLIQNGADVNAKDDLQDSSYLYAGAEGLLDILQMTVAAGADLRSVNRYGGTALIPAAHHGHVEVVRYLLTTKIDIDHINSLGWTALLEAVILGDGSSPYQQIVEELLNAGADASISDRDGVTPLEHAQQRGYKPIINILE